MPITLRPYKATDAAALVELFRTSVRSVAMHDYTPAQILAWAPDVMDEEKFANRCELRMTWIAELEDRIAGFADFESDGHIDMLYVHPWCVRRGVARALLQQIGRAAWAMSLRRLYTEASITARPAFAAMGFRVIAPQTVIVRGVSMTNYRMEKLLDEA